MLAGGAKMGALGPEVWGVGRVRGRLLPQEAACCPVHRPGGLNPTRRPRSWRRKPELRVWAGRSP